MILVLAGLGVVTFLAVLVLIADPAELRRRFNQAARLLSEAGPWLAAWLARKIRGEFAAPSRAAAVAANPQHPAVRPPGLPVDGRPLDAYEQHALDSLELRARVPHQRGQQ